MKTHQIISLFGLATLGACGVGGNGNDLPPRPADFAPGATIPGFFYATPSGSRAEVAARASYAQGRWEVLLARDLIPALGTARSGAPELNHEFTLAPGSGDLVRAPADKGSSSLQIRSQRGAEDRSGRATSNVAREGASFGGAEDVDLASLLGAGGTTIPFSVSVMDQGRGSGSGETRYPGPLLLTRDPSLTSTVFVSEVFVVDYGPSFAPASGNDFTDIRETRPVPSSGAGFDLRIKAGLDGGNRLHLWFSWADSSESRQRDQWRWNGFFWERFGQEDSLRVVFPLAGARAGFLANGGCAYLCHGPGTGPLGGPDVTFAAPSQAELCDLWIFSAGSVGVVEGADDCVLVSDRGDTPPEAAARAAWHGDSGDGYRRWNFDGANQLPLRMAAQDPNANAAAIGFGLKGVAEAIPFADALAGLPPTPPPGGRVSFLGEVRPILQMWCTGCHPPSGGLDLTTWSGLLAGGQSGPAVIPGNPDQSLLVLRISGAEGPQMPLGGPALSEADQTTIRAWIQAGAENN